MHENTVAVEPQSGAVKFRLLTRAAVTSQAPQGVGRIKAGTPSVELPTLDLPADVGFVARLVERKKVCSQKKKLITCTVQGTYGYGVSFYSIFLRYLDGTGREGASQADDVKYSWTADHSGCW